MKLMRSTFALLALMCGTSALFAQKVPKVKSQKEAEAVMAIQNAPDADARIAAVESLLTKYADTEFKAIALQYAAQSAREKNDFEKMVIYSERTIEADPQNYAAMLMLASGTAQRTREFDLDKEEKLTRAEKYANQALTTLKDAQKPRPDLPDDQWAAAKKDYESEAHEALGQIAMVRKKYDVAASEFKLAGDLTSTPNAVVIARMGQAQREGAKYDEAIATFDRVIAMPGTPDAVKQFAQQQKDLATKAKGTAKKP